MDDDGTALPGRTRQASSAHGLRCGLSFWRLFALRTVKAAVVAAVGTGIPSCGGIRGAAGVIFGDTLGVQRRNESQGQLGTASPRLDDG